MDGAHMQYTGMSDSLQPVGGDLKVRDCDAYSGWYIKTPQLAIVLPTAGKACEITLLMTLATPL